MAKLQPTVIAYDSNKLPEDFQLALRAYVQKFIEIQGNDSLIWVCPFDHDLTREAPEDAEVVIDLQDMFWTYDLPDAGVRVYYWW